MRITSVETEFWCPKAVAVDNMGDLYVGCAVRRGGLQKFAPSQADGALQSLWVAREGAVRGIALGDSDRIYATKGEGEVQEFSPDGECLDSWGEPGGGEGQFAAPSGIAVNASGDIYVVGASSWVVRGGGNRVQKFNRDHRFLLAWGTKGQEDGQLNLPTGIALDAQQNVYVADSYNSRVQIFSPDGEFLAKWGSFGLANGELNCPQGIAIDGEGYVYVADTYNNRLQKFTADGEFITKWSRCGTEESQFWLPCGVAVDETGVLYVADTMNHRIQIVEQ